MAGICRCVRQITLACSGSWIRQNSVNAHLKSGDFSYRDHLRSGDFSYRDHLKSGDFSYGGHKTLPHTCRSIAVQHVRGRRSFNAVAVNTFAANTFGANTFRSGADETSHVAFGASELHRCIAARSAYDPSRRFGGRFDQHVQFAPHKAGEVAVTQLPFEGRKLPAALGLQLRIDLVAHFGRRSRARWG